MVTIHAKVGLGYPLVSRLAATKPIGESSLGHGMAGCAAVVFCVPAEQLSMGFDQWPWGKYLSPPCTAQCHQQQANRERPGNAIENMPLAHRRSGGGTWGWNQTTVAFGIGPNFARSAKACGSRALKTLAATRDGLRIADRRAHTLPGTSSIGKRPRCAGRSVLAMTTHPNLGRPVR